MMNWRQFLGVGISIAKAIFGRYQAHRVAKRFAGTYAPQIIDGRSTRPMPWASPTAEFRVRSLFSREPGVLDGYAYDSTPEGKREHDSYIFTNPSRPTHADRTVVYHEGFEVSQQKIELIDNNIFVVPTEPDYGKHVLHRLHGQLFLD